MPPPASGGARGDVLTRSRRCVCPGRMSRAGAPASAGVEVQRQVPSPDGARLAGEREAGLGLPGLERVVGVHRRLALHHAAAAGAAHANPRTRTAAPAPGGSLRPAPSRRDPSTTDAPAGCRRCTMSTVRAVAEVSSCGARRVGPRAGRRPPRRAAISPIRPRRSVRLCTRSGATPRASQPVADTDSIIGCGPAQPDPVGAVDVERGRARPATATISGDTRPFSNATSLRLAAGRVHQHEAARGSGPSARRDRLLNMMRVHDRGCRTAASTRDVRDRDSSRLDAMDRQGVMPEPAAISTARPHLPGRARRSGPAGTMTSRVSPTGRVPAARFENAPPGTRRTPTSKPPDAPSSGAGADRVGAAHVRRRRSRCAASRTAPGRCRNVPRSGAGTARRTATASSVSARTSSTRSSWKRAGAAMSERLEVVERLAAREAAVVRLARGRAELGEHLGARRAATRARPGRRARRTSRERGPRRSPRPTRTPAARWP